MSPTRTATLAGTVGLAALLLPATFLVWHTLGSVFAAPPVWLCGKLLALWLPDLVANTSLEQTTLLLESTLGESQGLLLPAAEAGNALAFRQDTRIFSYSIPFFAALHFATPLRHSLERFARGLLVLWLLITLGLLCASLKDLMLGLGDRLFETGGLLPPPAAIGLAYQFSVLIVPVLAPVLLWAWESRRQPFFEATFNTGSPTELH